jgi:hypothetical protein
MRWPGDRPGVVPFFFISGSVGRPLLRNRFDERGVGGGGQRVGGMGAFGGDAGERCSSG